MNDTKPRAVRKDVLRNRALILEAADAVICASGMGLSLNAVAHHAGVGVGTVYRHFPDRDALITALFEQRVDQVCAIMRAHLHDTDPIAGLQAVYNEICEAQTTDRGVWEVVSAGSREPHREVMQRRVIPIARKLVRRANATGRLRTRFETNDLPVLLWTGGALDTYLGSTSPTARWRYVQLMFDSFLADDDPVRTPIRHKAPTIDEIDNATRSLHAS